MKDTLQTSGWHFPAHELHMQKWFATPKNRGDIMNGRLAYQGKKQRRAMSHVRQFRTAVDVGGHVGLHSFNLAHQFAQVHAFEPVVLHRKCFEANTAGLTNITLHAVALGKVPGSVKINTDQGSSGHSYVGGAGDTPMITLDSLDLTDVDYIKVDCEGYEENVLRGAERLLVTCKPVVMVEQKTNVWEFPELEPRGAVKFLQTLGYKVVEEISGDYIMVPA